MKNFNVLKYNYFGLLVHLTENDQAELDFA